MEEPLAESQVIRQLWSAYKKTDEYRIQKMTKAIPAYHPLVEEREKEGSRAIVNSFINQLQTNRALREELKKRSINEWMKEWCNMHRLLFHRILRKCGSWRTVDVRFGDPADADLYAIPHHQLVVKEISELAYQMPGFLSKRNDTLNEKCDVLAKVHYEFVRIHPFTDGNGRIAREISDQVAIYLGLPPAIAGYPRSDLKKKTAYHKAIRACAVSRTCDPLAEWVRARIEQQREELIA